MKPLIHKLLKAKNLAFISFILFFTSMSYAGGALCLYVNGAGTVVCSVYSNSGLGAEIDCRAEAQASNPACGLNLGTIDADAGSCASAIFGSPAVCLNDVSPYGVTGANQATCLTNGDRWCPSSYYGFFAGNSGCQDAICAVANTTLPVELINFQGHEEGSANIITWTTASEQNNDYFILENSVDGETWSSIAVIKGAGNSTERQNYEVIQMSPEKVLNYFRLHQKDIDGAITSYNPISIDNRDVKRVVVKVINLLGQEVDEQYKGLVVIYFDDGSHEKRMQ